MSAELCGNSSRQGAGGRTPGEGSGDYRTGTGANLLWTMCSAQCFLAQANEMQRNSKRTESANCHAQDANRFSPEGHPVDDRRGLAHE